MWRRVVRKDLLSSIPDSLDRKLHYPFLWATYGDYSREDATSVDSYLVATADGIKNPLRIYEPLKDEPYLFLEFAKIVESKDAERALEKWISAYGLLGLHRNEDREDYPNTLWELMQFPYKELYMYPELSGMGELSSIFAFSDTGGPEETFSSVLEEAHRANRVLAHYEAAMSKDEDKLETALMLGSKGSVEDLRALARFRRERSGGSYLDALSNLAAELVFLDTQDILERFTYPCIAIDREARAIPGPEALFTVDQFYRSWQPRNLLGALYLQAFWLVTSTAELSKCKYCGHIISYATPMPDSTNKTIRKPRRDKEFCNSRCRQNYHYHNRIKPTRQD